MPLTSSVYRPSTLTLTLAWLANLPPLLIRVTAECSRRQDLTWPREWRIPCLSRGLCRQCSAQTSWTSPLNLKTVCCAGPGVAQAYSPWTSAFRATLPRFSAVMTWLTPVPLLMTSRWLTRLVGWTRYPLHNVRLLV